jgi:hypothetical protein
VTTVTPNRPTIEVCLIVVPFVTTQTFAGWQQTFDFRAGA